MGGLGFQFGNLARPFHQHQSDSTFNHYWNSWFQKPISFPLVFNKQLLLHSLKRPKPRGTNGRVNPRVPTKRGFLSADNFSLHQTGYSFVKINTAKLLPDLNTLSYHHLIYINVGHSDRNLSDQIWLVNLVSVIIVQIIWYHTVCNRQSTDFPCFASSIHKHYQHAFYQIVGNKSKAYCNKPSRAKLGKSYMIQDKG